MAALSSTSLLPSSSPSSSVNDTLTTTSTCRVLQRGDFFSRIPNPLLQKMADYSEDEDLARWMKVDRRIAILPDPLQMAVKHEQQRRKKMLDQLDIHPNSLITKRTWVSFQTVAQYLWRNVGRDLARSSGILEDPKISVRLLALDVVRHSYFISSFFEGIYPRLKSLVIKWQKKLNELSNFGALREITIYNYDKGNVNLISDEFIAKVNKKSILIEWIEGDGSPSSEVLKKLSRITHLNHLLLCAPITQEPFDLLKNLTKLESLQFSKIVFFKDFLNFVPFLINLKALNLFACESNLIIQQLPNFKKLTDLEIFYFPNDNQEVINIESCIALQKLNLTKSKLSFSMDQIKDVLNAGEFQKINFVKLNIALGKEFDLFPSVLSLLDCPTIKNLCVALNTQVPKSKSEGLLEKINEAIVHQLFDNFKLFSVESNYEMTSHTFTLFE